MSVMSGLYGQLSRFTLFSGPLGSRSGARRIGLSCAPRSWPLVIRAHSDPHTDISKQKGNVICSSLIYFKSPPQVIVGHSFTRHDDFSTSARPSWRGIHRNPRLCPFDEFRQRFRNQWFYASHIFYLAKNLCLVGRCSRSIGACGGRCLRWTFTTEYVGAERSDGPAPVTRRDLNARGDQWIPCWARV